MVANRYLEQEAPVPADIFRLVADQHKFVAAQFPAIMLVAQSGLIAVLDSVSPPKWVNHDIRVAIPVNSGSKVLIKALDVVNCAELQLEILSLSAALSAPNIFTVPNARADPNTHTDIDFDPIPIDPPPPSTGPGHRRRFALEYTCDMRGPMTAIAGIKGPAAIKEAFILELPDIPFKSKTVYKHQQYFRDGIKHGLVGKLSALGRTPPGQWKELVKAVEAIRARRLGEKQYKCWSHR